MPHILRCLSSERCLIKLMRKRVKYGNLLEWDMLRNILSHLKLTWPNVSNILGTGHGFKLQTKYYIEIEVLLKSLKANFQKKLISCIKMPIFRNRFKVKKPQIKSCTLTLINWMLITRNYWQTWITWKRTKMQIKKLRPKKQKCHKLWKLLNRNLKFLNQ